MVVGLVGLIWKDLEQGEVAQARGHVVVGHCLMGQHIFFSGALAPVAVPGAGELSFIGVGGDFSMETIQLWPPQPGCMELEGVWLWVVFNGVIVHSCR